MFPKTRTKNHPKMSFGSLRKLWFCGCEGRWEMRVGVKVFMKSPARVCWACWKVSLRPGRRALCRRQDTRCSQLSWVRLIWFFVETRFRGPREVPRNSFTRTHLLVLLKRRLFSLQILQSLPATAALCRHQAFI